MFSDIENTVGLKLLSGEYPRKYNGAALPGRFRWQIDHHLDGRWELSTNDPDSGVCWTHEDGFIADSLTDCLAKLREIIEEAA